VDQLVNRPPSEQGGHHLKDYRQFDETRQAAYLCFGDPGFWDFLSPVAHAFKSVAPIISTATGFIPLVGPLVSKAVDLAAGAIQDDASQGNVTTDDQDDGTGANADTADQGY
jgi:hypothetical protein